MNIGSGLMKCLAYVVLGCALTQIAAFGADQAAPTANATASAEDAGLRAQVLLKRAVAHYQDIKHPALADFTSKGEFVDRELYVYVVSTAGVLLASGGPSSSVIGRNVADQQDALGKPFFRELLTNAQTNESGTVEYQWLNPVDNKVERKVAQFQKIGDRIIVVGYYVAHATPEQAQALLARAVDAVRANQDQQLGQGQRIPRRPRSLARRGSVAGEGAALDRARSLSRSASSKRPRHIRCSAHQWWAVA